MDSSLKYRKLDGADNAERTDVCSESLARSARQAACRKWFGLAGIALLDVHIWTSSSGVGKKQRWGPNSHLNPRGSLLLQPWLPLSEPFELVRILS